MKQIKQPYGEQNFTYDFAPRLGSLNIASIVSATSQARVGGTTLTLVGQAFLGQVATIRWGGGTDGNTYRTTVRVTDTDGGKHELDGEIEVKELDFVTPSSVTSNYLTALEYVARFGEGETVRITDETRAGVVNAAKMQAALDDAVQIVESYLSARYTLPLAPVPSMLKRIVGDLARELLHTDRPTDEIVARADRCRSDLKMIANGTMRLPVGGVPIVSGKGGAPIGVARDQVFSDAALSGYA